ncbi:MAG: hypothetical protein ABFS18_03275 [Thermodesulfobacteriota bacterium]
MTTKRMRRYTLLILMSLVGLVFAGCGGASDTSATANSSELSNIDISGASSLFIAESSTASASMSAATIGSTTKRIFKITPDGYIVEVTIKDKKGQTFTYQYEPSAVYDVNSEWVIITFGGFSYPRSGFLVRKSDGAVYELENSPSTNGYTFNNAKNIQLDAAGNIYYVNYGVNQNGAAVYKLDVSDQSNITETRVTPDTDNPLAFFVNPQGHVYYYYSSSNGNRIRMSNGGLVNLPTGQSLSAWIDLDGNISYISSSDGYFDVVIDDSFNVSTIQNPNPLSVSLYSNDVTGYLIKFIDRTIIATKFGFGPYILEVENPSNSPREISLPEISQWKKIVYSDNYYYLSGVDSSNDPILLKVDPTDDSVSVLLPNSGDYYDIQNMNVSPNDEVIFNALRMFDGAKVVGKIDSNGQLTILNETSSYSVTQIEMISHFQ